MPSTLLRLGLSGCRAACRKCELKVMPEGQCRGLTGMKPITFVAYAKKALDILWSGACLYSLWSLTGQL